MSTIALSHLLARGVRLKTHEAVALARELLAHPCGIPTPENVQLRSDGSACCINTDGTPSITSVADLLLMLLPPGTADVPAPLRYAIARGLEVVEAPPFASVREFSSALARFERGASRDVLRCLLQRGAPPARPSAAPLALAPLPVPMRPPAARPSPQAPGPMAVPPRPTLVVRDPPASASEPPQPGAIAPPTFGSFGVNRAGSPVNARRRALRAAAALVASFAVGFAVSYGINYGPGAAKPSGSARALPGIPKVAPAGNDSATNRADVEPTQEIVRLPASPVAPRESAPVPAKARADAAVDAPRAPVEPVEEQVTAIQPVRATGGNAVSPAFPSYGTAMFFSTGSAGRERDGRGAIEAAITDSAAGGELGIMTIVDDRSHNSHAQPSPDGRLVAFDSDRDGARGIYVANRDGSQVRRVSGAGDAAVPTWSRDGEWLAYLRPEADGPSVWNLWVQPAAGGSARRLTNHRSGQTGAASWFADDRRIAYSYEDTLIVMDVQTGEPTRYGTPVKGHLVRAPAVSPDGTMIIFQVARDGAWLLDLADGSMQRVLTDPTADEFGWSPDGRRVAFHSRRDDQWGIYVLWRR